MSEITKLYEKAGIKQERMCEWTCKGSKYCSTSCEHYESTQLYYPPFTAEKQLELIKWLCTEDDDFISIIAIDYGRWKINYNFEDLKSEEVKGRSDLNFENALANLINNLWQSLTEEEKQQVKGILE
ncbi:MAG: hypothetical protein J6Q32_05980 [Clostridia bacterium]|nr:hypothetical protein [Clostridia bacterium]